MLPREYGDQKEEILQLASRRKIYDLVKKFSGCNFRDLERKSSLPVGTLQYHLHYLAKHELIAEKKDGNKIRYFAKDIKPTDRLLLSLLRQKTIRHLLLFIMSHKKGRQQEIVAFLNLSPSTVSWYLSRLVKQNVLAVMKKEGEHCYRLALPEKEIITLLMTFKESFFDKMVDHTIETWVSR